MAGLVSYNKPEPTHKHINKREYCLISLQIYVFQLLHNPQQMNYLVRPDSWCILDKS